VPTFKAVVWTAPQEADATPTGTWSRLRRGITLLIYSTRLHVPYYYFMCTAAKLQGHLVSCNHEQSNRAPELCLNRKLSTKNNKTAFAVSLAGTVLRFYGGRLWLRSCSRTLSFVASFSLLSVVAADANSI